MPEKSVPVPKITPTNQLQKFIVINSRKYTKHPQTLKITAKLQNTPQLISAFYMCREALKIEA